MLLLSIGNWISGLDFDPTGKSIAALDQYGTCIISDVNTNCCNLFLDLARKGIFNMGYCINQHLLFVFP